eukprot:TRINITY_DN2395_c0_g1_i8.p2 TRINITY_DN2395_c0_g1~~TRINITY_DN2395_c0_g1_i8.p2  ORF type:complete len:119 (-),score=23.65 TRINITY_DN2395_c0_g1_i8:10-366(-)
MYPETLCPDTSTAWPFYRLGGCPGYTVGIVSPQTICFGVTRIQDCSTSEKVAIYGSGKIPTSTYIKLAVYLEEEQKCVGICTTCPYYLYTCLLYTSDAADDMQCVDLGGRRIIKKKKK